ncbi:hypothetical protein CK203_107567 [Vitis vinifera]|uniref:Uncharacterized protein n=1 Tax=Vitis vinifera TaxID=29760 RepID=A0A438DC19_VITVI|nr:hypothetical protein CK203_107567 [Vitis vinifera]
MKAFVSQRISGEEELRSRLEQAEASLSAARRAFEESAEALKRGGKRDDPTKGEVRQLWIEVLIEKKQKEDLQLRLSAQKEELEAKFAAPKEELETDYQKQVDEMYFFGYRCCMKKHGIKRNVPSIPRSAATKRIREACRALTWKETSEQTHGREAEPTARGRGRGKKDTSRDVVANMEARLAKVELAMADTREGVDLIEQGIEKGLEDLRSRSKTFTRGVESRMEALTPRVEARDQEIRQELAIYKLLYQHESWPLMRHQGWRCPSHTRSVAREMQGAR